MRKVILFAAAVVTAGIIVPTALAVSINLISVPGVGCIECWHSGDER